MEISEALKRFRKDFKLNQTEVANVLGITAQSYGRYEKESSAISAESAIKLANFFHVPIDYLLGRCDSPEVINYAEVDTKIIKAAVDCKSAIIALSEALKNRDEKVNQQEV